MGAVYFSIDSELIKVIKNALSIDVFIETGTFKGESVEIVKNYFKTIYSVELSDILYQDAQIRFKDLPHIQIIRGDSAEVLQNLKPILSITPVLYWLDAHWCVGTNTDGKESQCPLIKELNAISPLNPDSVIIIDDARLFLATPPYPHEISQWPSFYDVITSLMNLSDAHMPMVANDCILFFPKRIKHEIESYAYHHSVDWLDISNQSRDQKKLNIDLLNQNNDLRVQHNDLTNQYNKLLAQLKDLMNQHNELPVQHNDLMNKHNTIFFNRSKRLIKPFFDYIKKLNGKMLFKKRIERN